MDEEKESLIIKIKQRKELAGLANSYVLEFLENYVKKNKISIENLKDSEAKIIIKEVRGQLRKVTGRFQKSIKKRIQLLENNEITKLLKTHSSTSERLEFYPVLKNIIEKLNIKSILDLGCGLNPLAIADKNKIYYASDIKEDDLFIVEKFFKKNKIQGKTFIYDLKNIANDLPKVDLCILFKILDILEKNTFDLTKKIISNLDCKYLLISFATKTLSGKFMRHPRRKWFESILKNLNLEYEVINSDNEIFYLIKKNLS